MTYLVKTKEMDTEVYYEICKEMIKLSVGVIKEIKELAELYKDCPVEFSLSMKVLFLEIFSNVTEDSIDFSIDIAHSLIGYKVHESNNFKDLLKELKHDCKTCLDKGSCKIKDT